MVRIDNKTHKTFEVKGGCTIEGCLRRFGSGLVGCTFLQNAGKSSRSYLVPRIGANGLGNTLGINQKLV